MDFTQLFNIFLYEFVDLIPRIVLAYIPFRNYLRLSVRKTILLTIVLYLFVCASRFVALDNHQTAAIMTNVWIFAYLGFYVICIRSEIAKLLFVLMIILNYSSFTMIISYYLTYHVSDFQILHAYSPITTLISLLIIVPTYPLAVVMMNKKIKPLIEFSGQRRLWKYLWLVPATFCLSYYYSIYSGGGIVAFSDLLSNVLFAAGYNACAFFVTYLIAQLVEESNAKLLLKTENYHLSLQTLQYDNLQIRIEEARRARHDLRQILTVVQSHLQDENYDELKDYLSRYSRTLPKFEKVDFCSHYTLNAVIAYYDNLAKEYHITFQVEATLPSDIQMEDSDIAVLFGNLLENAIESCLRHPTQDMFIFLAVNFIQNALVITLRNSCWGTLTMKNGIIQSAKAEHDGIGLISIENIANKYHGTVKFHQDGAIFYSWITLHP